LPESIVSEIERQREARDAMHGTRTIIFTGGQVTVEANGHSVLVTEAINRNPGPVEWDFDDMLKTAYGQKHEVVRYAKVKRLPAVAPNERKEEGPPPSEQTRDGADLATMSNIASQFERAATTGK